MSVCLAACNFTPAHIPFPENENVFAVPVAKPFKPTAPKPFEFTTISSDSMQVSPPVRFDLDKLPFKPFAINDFKRLTDTIRQQQLIWKDLPDSAIDIEQYPAKPFLLRKSILPKPTVVKAGLPKLVSTTTTGVLQLGVEEGMPGLAISASVKDKFGTVWLATEKGLCRYAGDYIYIYSFLNKNPQGSDFGISHMTLDKEGNIWIVTQGDGIYIIDAGYTTVWHDQSHLDNSRIFCDHDGMIWITSLANGLYLVDKNRTTIKNIKNSNPQSEDNRILTIAEDNENNIWLGGLGNVAVLDASRKRLKKLAQAQGIPDAPILSFCQDWRGDMWISTYSKGLNVVSIKNNSIGILDQKAGFNGAGAELLQDGQQRLWIFRKDTSYILNKERTAVKELAIDALMIDQKSRGTSLQDNYGNIWLGTADKGVVILDTKGPLVENLDDKNGLVDNNVWGILEDKKGLVWMSTRQGVNIYDPCQKQIKLFGKAEGLGGIGSGRLETDSNGNVYATNLNGFSKINVAKKEVTQYIVRQPNHNFYIADCVIDTAGRLWLVSVNGIYLCDINKKSLQLISKSSGLLSNLTWDVFVDKQQRIWLGSDSGITIINPHNNTLQYVRQQEGLSNNVVYKILEGPDGQIWVGTIKGMSIIDPDKMTITNLSRKEGLVPEEVYDLVQQNGTVYSGSSDGMIAIAKPTTNKDQPWRFINYGKREGFRYNDFNQNTGTVLKNGEMWWGITPVLSVVTQVPLGDTTIPEINITGINIMDRHVSFTGYAMLNNGMKATDTIWNETKTGFYTKDKLPKDSGYLQANSIKWDSITQGFAIPVGLQLPYHQNSVNFSFSNNNINRRERVLYRYILEGADDKWSDVSDRSTTKNYFNLTAGNYTFRVRTLGANGTWSNEAICSFMISPPWWKTWWAYLLYVLSAIAIATAYANYRSYQLKKENAELENKIAQRTQELSTSIDELKATQAQLIQSEKMASLGELTAGIAHEIQNPLNFVNNFSEVSNELITELKDEKAKAAGERDEQLEEDILNDISQNLQKINHHGKRADAIVKGMLQHSRSSSGQKELTDINALADEYLKLSYHGLRAKDKAFNTDFSTDFDPAVGKIPIIPQDIGRVLLNLFNNAFYSVNEKKLSNSSFKPLLKVSTKKLGNKVEIKVEDNGNGIPKNIVDKIFQPFFTTKPTGQGTGLGLSLSYDIVKAHGGEIKVETVPGEGTEFAITLPA